MKQLGDIAGVFAYLSLLTVGGGMAAFPELKELTVNTFHWLTFPELLHYFSLGQLAPGPNMMMVASVGAHVAGVGLLGDEAIHLIQDRRVNRSGHQGRESVGRRFNGPKNHIPLRVDAVFDKQVAAHLIQGCAKARDGDLFSTF